MTAAKMLSYPYENYLVFVINVLKNSVLMMSAPDPESGTPSCEGSPSSSSSPLNQVQI
jgi:hypothetical protein